IYVKTGIAKIFNKAINKTHELTATHKNGNIIPIEMNLTQETILNKWQATAIIRDITEKKKIIKELEDSKYLMEKILNSFEDGIYLSSSDYEIKYLNPAMINKIGHNAVGEKCYKAIYNLNEKCSWCYFEKLKEKKGSTSVKVKIENKNYLVKSVLLDNNSKLTDYYDITEIEKAKSQLIRAVKKAQESDRLKSAFLANMSHEIRTPLNGIIGFAEILRSSKITKDKVYSFSDIIIQRSHYLLELINDILDLSKLEAGQVKVKEARTSINLIFDDIFVFFNSQSHLKKDVKLKYINTLNRNQSSIITDDLRLRQILINLISNAFKFTETGNIEFGCSLLDSKNLQFYIKDTGLGIPSDKQALIFERFGQVENTISRTHTGTGLGLAISKNLVNLMGGKIWLESIENEGTTFYFTMPYKPFKKTNPIHEIEITSKTYNWQNKTILIVEDDEISLKYLKQILMDTKVEIITTGNGKKAVEICYTNWSIDLVIMDIMLPDMDGHEATRLIKQIRKKLPIIAQTANVQTKNREKSEKAGCDEFIIKPINSDSLLGLINKYFN
ncbi:MAG: response regulator, partial [Chlorobi bacterium]|nr:response regulator [Chlorobiota bacterium]